MIAGEALSLSRQHSAGVQLKVRVSFYSEQSGGRNWTDSPWRLMQDI